MSQHLYVLTGASRGMGLAMAEQLLVPGNYLLCISRQVNKSLAVQAELAGVPLLQWAQDLASGAHVSLMLENWFLEQKNRDFASATLVNNAGAIPRVVPLSDADPDDLSHALRVGLEAPMQLTSAFLRATRSWQEPRKVLNISSGLGRRAMASQAAYCAAKAGMDHFTRCIALEEASQTNGAKVCSLAPGVIDTDMQTQLRAADSKAFPERSNFVNLKTSGSLSSPADAAKRVLTVLMRDDFGSDPVSDVKN